VYYTTARDTVSSRRIAKFSDLDLFQENSMTFASFMKQVDEQIEYLLSQLSKLFKTSKMSYVPSPKPFLMQACDK